MMSRQKNKDKVKSRKAVGKRVLPVSKASRPSKDGSNAIGTGFTSLLVNPEVTCYCAVSSFGFYSFPIRANL
jgi:hypothetical protein